MSKCNFTHEHYLDTLKAYVSSGYKVISFEEMVSGNFLNDEKYVILRHDVDLDFDAAYRMAELDSEAGCKATYFFRLHATGYSMLELGVLKKLKEIRQMGHEIGFHYEPSMANVLGESPIEFADRQKRIFEDILGFPIIGMSPHEPSRTGQENLVDVLTDRWGLKYHAYQDQFFKSIKYISDSSARWREGCFCQWCNKVDKLQILVHPFWWYKTAPQENY